MERKTGKKMMKKRQKALRKRFSWERIQGKNKEGLRYRRVEEGERDEWIGMKSREYRERTMRKTRKKIKDEL